MAATYKQLEWIIANYTVNRMVTSPELNLTKIVLDVEISWGNKRKDSNGDQVFSALGEEVWIPLFTQRFFLTAQNMIDYFTDLASGDYNDYKTALVPNNVGNTAYEVTNLMTADGVMAAPIYNFVSWAMNKGILGDFG